MKNRIANLRKEAQITQNDLSNMLNITQATLSNWENGIYEADIESLIKISQYFGVPIDYIVCNDEVNFEENIFAGAAAHFQSDLALHAAIAQKYGYEVLTLIDMYRQSPMPKQGKIFKIINDLYTNGITDEELSLIIAYRKDNKNLKEAINLLTDLDTSDLCEIKGSVKQMLKSDKYLNVKQDLA